MMRRITIVLLVLYLISYNGAFSQAIISPLRYNDDFNYLKNDSLKNGFEAIKYLKLGNLSYISLGGELREQLQYFENINFGDVPPNYLDRKTFQLWHRFLVHSNLEFNENYRVFIQLNNTLRFLNKNPIVKEIDENQLSLHQAFAEIKQSNFIFRLGRQELLYGNNRLISVREGPNTRLSFDAVIIKYFDKLNSIDFIYSSPVISNQYVFDDQHFKETLMGIYGTFIPQKKKIGLDYYAINFQSKLRQYNFESGYENRQTFGVRSFSKFKNLNFEFEASYQTGKFNDLRIEAYNLFADVNYAFLEKEKLKIGVSYNRASGDKNNTDNKLNTYNLLYAKPAFGQAIPIGSTNLVSIFPYVKTNPLPNLSLLGQVFFIARESSFDGIYSPGMVQNRPKPNQLFISKEKTLGTFYVFESNYNMSKNLAFAFDASFFKAGKFIKSTGQGKDITYLSFKSTFKI